MTDYILSVEVQVALPEWLFRHSHSSVFAWGSQQEAWISDLHIVQMNQSLRMTLSQHTRPLLFPFPVDCGVCGAQRVQPQTRPSCFLSLILLHQWGNVWPCRAKQQLWSQSVQGSVWHGHPQGWFLRWIRHPKETLQTLACSKASSSFFIVLSPANVEGSEKWKSVCTKKPVVLYNNEVVQLGVSNSFAPRATSALWL